MHLGSKITNKGETVDEISGRLGKATRALVAWSFTMVMCTNLEECIIIHFAVVLSTLLKHWH